MVGCVGGLRFKEGRKKKGRKRMRGEKRKGEERRREVLVGLGPVWV